jgi:hypothetical protein
MPRAVIRARPTRTDWGARCFEMIRAGASARRIHLEAVAWCCAMPPAVARGRPIRASVEALRSGAGAGRPQEPCADDQTDAPSAARSANLKGMAM